MIERDLITQAYLTSMAHSRQTRAAAVRTLARLATDTDDFRRLADMLGLDPAEARQ